MRIEYCRMVFVSSWWSQFICVMHWPSTFRAPSSNCTASTAYAGEYLFSDTWLANSGCKAGCPVHSFLVVQAFVIEHKLQLPRIQWPRFTWITARHIIHNRLGTYCTARRVHLPVLAVCLVAFDRYAIMNGKEAQKSAALAGKYNDKLKINALTSNCKSPEAGWPPQRYGFQHCFADADFQAAWQPL